MKLKWYLLKQNKCPQCGDDFDINNVNSNLMIWCPCGFRISEDRYKQIVTEMVNKEIDNRQKVC
jgi:hypothetical protein